MDRKKDRMIKRDCEVREREREKSMGELRQNSNRRKTMEMG